MNWRDAAGSRGGGWCGKGDEGDCRGMAGEACVHRPMIGQHKRQDALSFCILCATDMSRPLYERSQLTPRNSSGATSCRPLRQTLYSCIPGTAGNVSFTPSAEKLSTNPLAVCL